MNAVPHRVTIFGSSVVVAERQNNWKDIISLLISVLEHEKTEIG
jgi:hypothetical protein